MDQINPGQNTGVREVMPIVTDWQASGETGLIKKTIVPGGDWRPYLPTDEKQLMIVGDQSYGDTNCCTNFSSTNVCEMYLNALIASNSISADQLNFLKTNGYFDSNGKINFSDRFDAYVSGTDPHVGNYLPKVWAAKHTFGMVPESAWPKPTAEWAALVATNVFQSPYDFWPIYFKTPPQAVFDLGKEFRKHFDVKYEWVSYPGASLTMAQYKDQLQYSPLQILSAVCHGWNTDDPILGCGAGTQHATTMMNIEPSAFDIEDHYNPFQKRFSPDYTITYSMRGIITDPDPVVPTTFHHTFTLRLRYQSNSNDANELKAFQQALQTLKDHNGVPYMKAGVFGPFGPQTKDSFSRFQTDNKIVDPDGQGTNFGPQSRALMNKLLNG